METIRNGITLGLCMAAMITVILWAAGPARAEMNIFEPGSFLYEAEQQDIMDRKIAAAQAERYSNPQPHPVTKCKKTPTGLFGAVLMGVPVIGGLGQVICSN